MPSHDEMTHDLRSRLNELFAALHAALQGVADRGGELTGRDVLLLEMHERIRPALMEEVNVARQSYAAVRALSQVTARVLGAADVPDRGPGSQAYRPLAAAIRQLSQALASSQDWREREAAEELEDLKALVQNVAPQVLTPLEAMLLRQHRETTVTLGQIETAVGQVAPAVAAQLPPLVVTPLETTLDSQYAGTTAALGQIQTAVEGVTPAVVTQVPPLVLHPLETALRRDEQEAHEELEEIEGLLKELPQRLSDALIKSLPAAVAAVVTALKSPSTPVSIPVTPVTITTVAGLAAAQARDYITSGAERILFLQTAITILQSAYASGQPPTPVQSSQITAVVLDVINHVDPTLAPGDLYTITGYKQQFAQLFTSPALAGGS